MARTDQPHKLSFDVWVAQCTDFDNPRNEKHRGLDYARPETRAAWNGSKSKVPIWCDAHQKFFVQQAANHMNGQGCPECGFALRTLKKTKKDPLADFRRVHGDTYDYSRVAYKNTHTKVEIICAAHGPFLQKPFLHLQGHGCPMCWETRRKAFGKARNANYREMYAERAARVHDGKYAILKLPEGAHDTVVLACPKHGEFEQKAYSHLDGHGCYTCGAHAATTQRGIAALIESWSVKVEHDDRKVLGGKHIDIWAPELRIGVEYHGMHWHTEDRVGNKHREKWETAEKAGIRLIQMFDYEWLENPYAVEERLKALFGVSEVSSARKLAVRSVPPSDACAFFTEVHTQGRGSTPSAAYGLFDGDTLVACQSFGKAARFKQPDWELYRYASKGRVQGGFTRLLKAFIREHSPERIVSYCDLRWGNGTVYKNAGFVLDHITRPDYWYSFRDRRVERYAAQHRPKGQTEREWAEEHDYKKVLGVGHQRWVWTRPT